MSDNTPPTITCPTGGTTFIASAICLPLIPPSLCSLLQVEPASDNCGLVTSSFTLVSQAASGTCPRTVTRTYSIADSCGNVSSCSQAFTVSDNTAPANVLVLQVLQLIASAICLLLIPLWHCSLLQVVRLPITAGW